jgi:hypothetical protein
VTANRTTKERRIPPLQNGDHLTVREFERRYEAMPHVKKAELIDGVVFMPSPVRIDDHGEHHANLITWLGLYSAYTPGVGAGDNATVRLRVGENEPQPDACLRIRPDHGGQSATSEDGYIVGGPEWVGEVAATTASYDLHEKLDAYQANGVKEYVVCCVQDRSILWFVLRGAVFRPLQPRGGVYRSKVFPGLWLDASAMTSGDLATVLRVLQRGLDSDEHRRFVARLAKRKKNNTP